MTLTEILNQIRDVYIDEFSKRLERYPAEVSRALLVEALYLTTEGEPIRTGDLQLPARGDLCVSQDRRIREIARIEASRSVQFDAFRFVWNDRLQVALNPFVWSGCAICIPEPMQALQLAPLAEWFESHVQPDLRAGRDASSLLEVAHSMSSPKPAADGVRFEVDFGSMPVAGVEAMLNALAQTGAGLAVVGHRRADRA